MDVLLAVAAVVTLVSLVRSWRSFWDTTYTLADRRLGLQVAVFLVPPVVVLLHELGHLVVARLVGARVTRFRYGLFEGSVTIVGRITPAQDWLVALAGNAVSVAVGLAMVAVGASATRLRRGLRHVLVMGGLFELGFSLVGYPLISLSTNFGDWRVIYDFGATPGLSWATAAVHAGVLAGLWRWWRQRGRAGLFAITQDVEGELAPLQRAVASAPSDEEARLPLAQFYLERGETGLARATLDGGVPGASPRLHLARARLALFERRWNDAVVAARAGLDTGAAADDEVGQRLWANLALALGEMERPDLALAAFGHLRSPVAEDARVAYGRGLARIATGDPARGRADLEAVALALPENDWLRQWAQARLVGGQPKPADDSHLPVYARGGGPPPAPIAGV